jgi:antitoxin MazE
MAAAPQKIAKWGNSLAVRIPQKLADQAGLSDGTPVEVQLSHGKLVIVPKIPEYDIRQLVRKITKENRHELIDWGPPVGKEFW